MKAKRSGIVSCAVLGALVVCWAVGCGPTRDVEPPPAPRARSADDSRGVRSVRDDGPFPPERLRIHPLTGFVAEEDGTDQLEVHLELTDAFGHVVKALGRVTLELYDDRGPTGAGPEQLERWVLDLEDAAASSRPFDRVTRTYRFSLVGLPNVSGSRGRLLLAARFETVGGRELIASFRLGREGDE